MNQPRVSRAARTVLLCLMPLLASSSCAHKVISFSVEPPLVCPGQTVDVQWNVQGRASLRIAPGSGESREEQVPSVGERKLQVVQNTTFTIRALDANPADGKSFGSKSVDVPQGPVTKAAASTCDSTSRRCTGTFELTADGRLQVRTIAAPKIVRAGRVLPGRICVGHEGLAPTCVSANDQASIAVPAGGVWTLETDLADGEDVTPGPQLRIQVGFGCP